MHRIILTVVYSKKVFTMNRKQKIVLWIGIVIIVLMCLFPPWVRVIEIEGSRLLGTTLYEFPIGSDGEWWDDIHFLLSPPEPLMVIDTFKSSGLSQKDFPFTGYGYEYRKDVRSAISSMLTRENFGLDHVSVDMQRLYIQCMIVVLLTVGLVCSFATKIENKHKEQKIHHIPIPEVQARK
jgi:hypothetical protein